MSIFTHQVTQKATIALLLCAMVFTPILSAPKQAHAQGTTAQQQQLLVLYQQLFALQQQLNTMLQQQAGRTTTVTSTIRPEANPFFVNITTGPALSIERDTAQIQVFADKGGSRQLDVWVQYGANNTLNQRSDVTETTNSGNRSTSYTLNNLAPNTRYVYRAVAEDQNGNRITGQIRYFTTIARITPTTFTGQPTVETEGVTNIRATSARLHGFISLNDIRTGSAFFVYGTDRTQINNTTRYTSFNDIPTARNVSGKTMVNRTFSGRNTIAGNASNLLRGTTYYYRVCTAYGERTPTIRCGQIETFTTQN